MRAAQVVLIAACLQLSGHVFAVEIEACGPGRIVLEATTGTANDVRLACEAVSQGVEFLRSRGVESDAPLRLRIVDELPSRHDVTSLGQFDPRQSEIRILSLARCLTSCAEDAPFKIPMNAEIYRSFVVHEVVHAITHVAFAGREVRRIHMEYLAYVVQFASLPDDLRERLIAASGVDGFEREEQVNEFVYFADPNRFGIMCYLHYRRPENGDAYLGRIFSR